MFFEPSTSTNLVWGYLLIILIFYPSHFIYLLYVKNKTCGLSLFFYFLSNFPKPMFPLLPNTNKKQASFETCVQNKHIMDQNITVPRIHAFSSPPSPPLSSCIIALSIATLIFMFFYVFSPIFSAAILLALCIIALLFCTFTQDQTFAFHAHTTPPKNQRLVKIFNNLFWVVEEKRSGKTQQVMKLLGSIVCFQNQPFLSGEQNSLNETLFFVFFFIYA